MTPAEAVLAAFAAPVLGATGYLALLTVLSRRPEAPESGAAHLRFAVVVPAHDESLGIAATVTSLLALDYPRELCRVVVVADNCTDDTAERARAAGAEVLTRRDPARRGKGYALAHAFERLLAEGRVDAVVVVDADTLVSPNLLRAFAARLDAGACVVQADYAVQNPAASWRTRLMTIAFATVVTLRSLGRERLRLSSGLRGNGMCFASSILRDVPYDAFSVVEDLEYAIRLGLAGHRVHYAGEAHVRGEMPSGEKASRTQRERWEAGRMGMVRQHTGKLLARAVSMRDPVALDLAMELLVPPLATLASATALGLGASLALSLWTGRVTPVAGLWLGSALGLCAYGIRGWQLSGTGARGLLGLMHVPAYIAWKLSLPLRRSAHASGEWVRTAREGEAP